MFKRLGMLMILAIGSLMVFVSCAEDKADDDIPPVDFADFTAFAAMEGYANPIIPGMKLNLVDALRVNSGDLIDNADNKTIFYTYVDQPVKTDNTQAVYKFGDAQFFGVKVSGEGSGKALTFVFEKTADDKSAFFTTAAAVTFDVALTKNSIPASIDNFRNLAAGAGYKFLDKEAFIISGDNMIDDDNHTLFTYNNHLADNKTHAVYKSTSVVNPSQFLGVILVSSSNPRVLKFYVNGTAQNPTYFPTAGDVNFDTEATDKLPTKSFLDEAAGRSYQLIIENNGVLTKLEDNGDIVHGATTYAYVSSADPLTAVYKKGATEFFGVQIDEAKLNFYLDNSSDPAIGAYWTAENNVKFVEGTGVMLAKGTPNSALLNGSPSVNITDVDGQVPTTGVIASLYKNNELHLLADNKTTGQSGTLFKKVINDPTLSVVASEVATNAVTEMKFNSLQLIGTTLFIVSKDDTNVNIFNADGTLISRKIGFDNSVKAHTYAIGANSGDKFIMASNNTSGNAGKYRIVESTGFQGTPLGLIDTSMVPTSVIGFNEYVYMAGNVAGDVKIIKSLGSSILLDPITGSNGKLIEIKGMLYLIVTDSGTKMYKITEDTNAIVTGATLPVDFESIVADDKYVYITSRATNGTTLIPTVYTLSDTTLTKVADAATMTIANVSPAVVSLGSDLGIAIVDVENIGGKNVLRFNNLIVSDGPYVMP